MLTDSVSFFIISGAATRCSRYRLCFSGYGHRRRCRSGLERSSNLREEVFQSSVGQQRLIFNAMFFYNIKYVHFISSW